MKEKGDQIKEREEDIPKTSCWIDGDEYTMFHSLGPTHQLREVGGATEKVGHTHMQPWLLWQGSNRQLALCTAAEWESLLMWLSHHHTPHTCDYHMTVVPIHVTFTWIGTTKGKGSHDDHVTFNLMVTWSSCDPVSPAGRGVCWRCVWRSVQHTRSRSQSIPLACRSTWTVDRGRQTPVWPPVALGWVES